MLDASRTRDQIVEVHDRAPALDSDSVHSHGTELWPLDHDRFAEVTRIHAVGREPGLDDQQAAGLEVASHRRHCEMQPVERLDIADAAEQACDNIERCSEVQGAHVTEMEAY